MTDDKLPVSSQLSPGEQEVYLVLHPILPLGQSDDEGNLLVEITHVNRQNGILDMNGHLRLDNSICLQMLSLIHHHLSQNQQFESVGNLLDHLKIIADSLKKFEDQS